ncbi:MAG: 30S ribosomal protein S8 [Candidatus Neomarinimicrobiota bacterium]
MTDPIADLLTRIRNAQSAGARWVDIPLSILKKRVLFILREESYIEDFIIISEPVRKKLRVFLRYDRNGDPVISHIKRVSKPGRRVYARAEEIPRVLDGLGIAILTTSRGVMSDKVARRLNVGGEIICNVW